MSKVTYLVKGKNEVIIPYESIVYNSYVGCSLPIVTPKEQEYMNRGYSLIRAVPYGNIGSCETAKKYMLTVLLNEMATLKDKEVINKVIEKLIINHNIIGVNCTNLRKNDYDYLYIYAELLKKLPQAISSFLGEKQQALTKQEQIIMKNYRTFSLEQLLYGKKFSNSIISNDGCGVMIIFSDFLVAKTNTKVWHEAELDQIMERHPCNGNEIIIKIFDSSLCIQLPEYSSMTDYQIKSLYKIASHLIKLAKSRPQAPLPRVDVGYFHNYQVVQLIGNGSSNDTIYRFGKLTETLKLRRERRKR